MPSTSSGENCSCLKRREEELSKGRKSNTKTTSHEHMPVRSPRGLLSPPSPTGHSRTDLEAHSLPLWVNV